MSDRFVIAKVTGFAIGPEPGQEPVPSFAVLDTACCHRIVREFGAGSNSPAWRQHEQDAYAFCRDLNHWDREFAP